MTTLIIRVHSPAPDGNVYPVTADLMGAGPGGEPPRGRIPHPLPPSPLGDRDVCEFVLNGAEGREGTLSALGAWLNSLIDAGEVGTRLREHWAAREGSPEGKVHRVLLDLQSADLRRLPWELLNCGPELPFIDPDHPWVRGTFDPAAEEPPDIGVPLRMMAVVADSSAQDLGWEAEISAIQVGLRKLHAKLHAEVLCDPSRKELFTELSLIRPHILHVIGHGAARDRDGMPQIRFRDRSTGDRWWLTSEVIANGIGPRPPRLVVLNVCRAGDLATHAGTWNLVDTLGRKGVLGVVAMQADVESEMAVTFAQTFYEHLGDGHPVDVAANRGRQAVWYRSGPEQHAWALPSLTVWGPPDRILRLRCGAADGDIEAVRRTHVHRRIEKFVDRYRERRMWLAVDPDENPERPERGVRVLLVTGEKDAGKTDLLYSCLLTCFLRGRRLSYVDLDRQPMDWLDVLRRIRRGVPGLPLSPSLDAFDREAFKTWGHDINWLARGEWAAPYHVGPPDDELARFASRSEHADLQIDYAFELFRDGLSRLTAGQPFIIALDHIDGVTANDFERFLWPKLIQPVADGAVGQTRMIVVLRSDHQEFMPDDADLEHVEEVRVQVFRREEFPRLAREYFARHGVLHSPELSSRFAADMSLLEPTWTPRQFEALRWLLRGSAR